MSVTAETAPAVALIFDFDLQTGTRAQRTAVTIKQLVVAGWTGRDPVAVEKHIKELEELGVKRPASTPIFYRASVARLTTQGVIEATGDASGGEVEYLLLRHEGRLWVGAGSDHTDRQVETSGVTVSKQMCDKPLAPVLWNFADIADHWDQIVLRSFATINGARVLYQEGRLDGMLGVDELIVRGFDGGKLPDGCAVFGGTFAAKGGIRSATRFEFEIDDPVLKRSIRHGYDVIELPVLG